MCYVVISQTHTATSSLCSEVFNLSLEDAETPLSPRIQTCNSLNAGSITSSWITSLFFQRRSSDVMWPLHRLTQQLSGEAPLHWGRWRLWTSAVDASAGGWVGGRPVWLCVCLCVRVRRGGGERPCYCCWKKTTTRYYINTFKHAAVVANTDGALFCFYLIFTTCLTLCQSVGSESASFKLN